MGKITKIAWTEGPDGTPGHTWNPWQGCHKVSAGCKHCYMYRDKTRYGQDPSVVVRSSKQTFNAPLKWKDGAVFICSWSDFYIAEADPWRAEAWDIIRRTPHLTYLIVTKRPERMAACLPPDWPAAFGHVWLGVTAEDQQRADERIPLLLQTPAAHRWVSLEPLLGPICLTDIWTKTTDGEQCIKPLVGLKWGRRPITGTFTCTSKLPKLGQIIVGGESGPGARPYDLAWPRSVIAQGREAGVPCFHKQVGSNAVAHSAGFPEHLRFDVKTRSRSGADPAEWPEDLRVRELAWRLP